LYAAYVAGPVENCPIQASFNWCCITGPPVQWKQWKTPIAPHCFQGAWTQGCTERLKWYSPLDPSGMTPHLLLALCARSAAGFFLGTLLSLHVSHSGWTHWLCPYASCCVHALHWICLVLLVWANAFPMRGKIVLLCRGQGRIEPFAQFPCGCCGW